MTQTQRSDALLKIANIFLLIMQSLVAIGGLAIAVGLPLLLFLQDRFAEELQVELNDPNITFPVAAIAGVLVLALIILAMAFYFFDRMRRIVGTVEEGDPFVPENAQRLTFMAWLMLGMQLLALPAAGLAVYIATRLGEDAGTIDASFDLNGIIMVLTLFILARVFRKGTEMRDDLEGTV